MFKDGPAIMELNKLENNLAKLQKETFGDNYNDNDNTRKGCSAAYITCLSML
jgi:hypothetical protein